MDEEGIMWAVSWAIYGRGPAVTGTRVVRAEEQWQAVEETVARVLDMDLPFEYTEDDIKIKHVSPDDERTAGIRRRDQAIFLLYSMGVTSRKLAYMYNVPAYAIRAILATMSGRSKKSVML